MIKKTIQTLKQNPIIIAVLFIPFVYNVINTVFFSDASFVSDPIAWFQSFDNPIVIVGLLFSILYYVGYTVFLYPVISRYIYLAADDLPRDKWYKKCFKGFWWRGIVLGLALGLMFMVAIIPIAVIYIIISAVTRSLVSFMIYLAVMVILLMIFSTVNYIATAAVFAEEYFSDGFSNIFKAWKKCFSKILPLALINVIPMIIMFVVLLASGKEQMDNTTTLLSSFFFIVFSIFAAVYSMHCYLAYKKTTLIPLGDEDMQAEENDEAQLEA